MNGFVGMLLYCGVTEVGDDLRLIHEGPGDGARSAGVEHAAAQLFVGDSIDQPLCALLQLVSDPQCGKDVGH